MWVSFICLRLWALSLTRLQSQAWALREGKLRRKHKGVRLCKVCLYRLCIQCRGHGRLCPSVTHTICMLLKSVAYTGLCWMLSSVIMSRHKAGRLFSLCGSRVCVCACLYVLRDSCRSTVHSHILRRLTALRHKSSISCLQCLRFPVLNASPLGDIVILPFLPRTRQKYNLSSKIPPHFVLFYV